MLVKRATGYNGNENLTKAGTIHEWTPDQLSELAKCASDPVYFSKFFTIVHADHGYQKLDLYQFQKDALSAYIDKERKMILNTSRQIGKTTIATVIILHYAIFNEARRIAILANKGDQAIEILERIQIAFEYLPKWLQVGVKEWNKKSVVFENGSKIVAAATSSSAIRGKTQNMLYIDETAFVKGWDTFSASVLPTLSSGKETYQIFTSTPNGLNHWYDYCEGAKAGINGYKYFEVPYWLIPNRDEAWKQEVLQTLNFDMDRFEQEYCCSFQGSSSNLLKGSTLKLLKPEAPLYSSPEFRQYDLPEKGMKYVACVDVAHGMGQDSSVVNIFNISVTPYKQVFILQSNKIKSHDLAPHVLNIAKIYNDAYVLVELNDIGQQVADALWYEHDYDNLLRTKSKGRLGYKLTWSGGNAGLVISKTTKAVGCSNLKLIMETNKLHIVDKNTIEEFKTFSKKASSYEAEDNFNDDCVMTCVHFGWLVSQREFQDVLEVDGTSFRILSDEEIEADLVPFGFKQEIEEESRTEMIGGELWTKIGGDGGYERF